MQPDNNRQPDEAEDAAGNDANDGAFTPGDSFTNDSSDQAGTGELPSWLQNFAGVAGESSGEQAATHSEAAPARTPVSQIQPSEATPDVFTQPPAGGDTNFFSEDDLPEWLRALNTDSEPAAVAAPGTPMPVANATSNGALPVPAVSRAWVTASDQPEVSPAANLMSSLVNVIDSRPDAVAVEPAVAASSSSTNVRVASAPKAAAPVAAGSATTNVAERGNRSRMLLIAAIILLVLIIVVVLFGN